MKANKQITIKDLTLNNPTAAINSVQYNWVDDTASIEVIFQEDGANHKHSRSFEMDTKGEEVTPTEVLAFIKKELPDFK